MSQRRFCDRCNEEIKEGEKFSSIGGYDFCRKKCFELSLKGLGVKDKISEFKEYEE